MPTKPIVWIIDTSILMNVLDVPGFNQDRMIVLDEFKARYERGDSLLLPFTSIIETGNHIGQLTSGNQRQRFAEKFVAQVIQALNENAPWKPLAFPAPEDLIQWLSDFPNNAQQRIGLGDHMIIKQWNAQCSLLKAYTVKIWSLDTHLQGYECNH